MFTNRDAAFFMWVVRRRGGGPSAELRTGGPGAARLAPVALWLAVLACVGLYVLFSDLKGISTDEGIRLAAINGNRLFEGDQPGTTARWKDVKSALSTTNYQPLYYYIQNLVMRIAQSRDPVLLKSVNILFLFGCILVTLRMTVNWPPLARWYLVVTTYFSGYLLMHVLQVREYALGLLFLAAVYACTYRLAQRQADPLRASDVALYGGYGLLAGAACLNSFWIVPAWAGAAAGLLLLSRRRLPALGRLAIAGAALVCVLAAIYLVQGFEKKIDVGLWDRNVSLERFARLAAGGFSYIVAGNDFPQIHVGVPSLGELAEMMAALAVCGGVVGFAAPAVLRAWRAGPLDRFEVHCVLALAMIAALCLFQTAYFAVRRDALPMWPRYFFQHFWLLHVLMAATVARLALSVREGAGSPGRRRLRGAGLAVLLAAGAAWSVKGTLAYYVDPFGDTGLSKRCEWRTLAPRLRDLAGGDAIVFTRMLEAGTISYSARFLNRLMVWDRMPRDTAAWPSPLVLVDAKGVSSPQEVLARRAALAEAGFHALSEQSVDAGPQPCNLSATVSRFARGGPQ